MRSAGSFSPFCGLKTTPYRRQFPPGNGFAEAETRWRFGATAVCSERQRLGSVAFPRQSPGKLETIPPAAGNRICGGLRGGPTRAKLGTGIWLFRCRFVTALPAIITQKQFVGDLPADGKPCQSWDCKRVHHLIAKPKSPLGLWR